MKNNFKYLAITFLLLSFSLTLFSQESNNETTIPEQASVKYENGTILKSFIGTFHGRNFEICDESYCPYLLGVFYDDNVGEYDPRMTKVPIKTKGMHYVKYNNENGPIMAGDPVTSSSTPGEAMKATESGMILGIALEDASNSNGLVKIRILIQYVR